MVDNFIAEFTDDDFMRIWKGLFYCMWMADKPLVQVLVMGQGSCRCNGGLTVFRRVHILAKSAN